MTVIRPHTGPDTGSVPAAGAWRQRCCRAVWSGRARHKWLHLTLGVLMAATLVTIFVPPIGQARAPHPGGRRNLRDGLAASVGHRDAARGRPGRGADRGRGDQHVHTCN
ncbi:drug efflux membrane protein [Mycolicibacterium thermoresistibile]|uniref:Drug efflux membrane protein n=1 Tax=Mycolicibacterium thermoresistibile TaxID=1797 RepID=A0A100XJ49_MYCTH|nr:drug efflux membrane protein [Mycolicibacterium thermoresistibile]